LGGKKKEEKKRAPPFAMTQEEMGRKSGTQREKDRTNRPTARGPSLSSNHVAQREPAGFPLPILGNGLKGGRKWEKRDRGHQDREQPGPMVLTFEKKKKRERNTGGERDQEGRNEGHQPTIF